MWCLLVHSERMAFTISRYHGTKDTVALIVNNMDIARKLKDQFPALKLCASIRDLVCATHTVCTCSTLFVPSLIGLPAFEAAILRWLLVMTLL